MALILEDFFRAQVVLRGKSGRDDDVYVTNFIFRNDQDGNPISDVADHIQSQLQEFFEEATPSGQRVSSFLAGQIIQTDAEIRVYDLGKPTPRLPSVRALALPSMSTAPAMPPEVAACLSYYAGRPLPRRRGRIYLGPLAIGASAVTDGNVRVNASCRATFAEAGARLADEGFGGVNWCVLSQRDGNAFEITGGWVDNDFDTQQRRSSSATERTLWGAPPSE